jgi:hypothetical protein
MPVLLVMVMIITMVSIISPCHFIELSAKLSKQG